MPTVSPATRSLPPSTTSRVSVLLRCPRTRPSSLVFQATLLSLQFHSRPQLLADLPQPSSQVPQFPVSALPLPQASQHRAALLLLQAPQLQLALLLHLFQHLLAALPQVPRLLTLHHLQRPVLQAQHFPLEVLLQVHQLQLLTPPPRVLLPQLVALHQVFRLRLALLLHQAFQASQVSQSFQLAPPALHSATAAPQSHLALLPLAPLPAPLAHQLLPAARTRLSSSPPRSLALLTTLPSPRLRLASLRPALPPTLSQLPLLLPVLKALKLRLHQLVTLRPRRPLPPPLVLPATAQLPLVRLASRPPARPPPVPTTQLLLLPRPSSRVRPASSQLVAPLLVLLVSLPCSCCKLEVHKREGLTNLYKKRRGYMGTWISYSFYSLLSIGWDLHSAVGER